MTSLIGLAAERHAVAGAVERFGGVDDLLDSGVGKVSRLLVELERQVGDVAAGGDLV